MGDELLQRSEAVGSADTSSHAGGALPPPDRKAATVRGMFGAIAPRYDLLNHLLSLNLDRRWRRLAVDRLLGGGAAEGVYLDACAGTLDLAVELAERPAFRGRVVACDFAFPMLASGVSKVERLPVDAVCGDALSLPLADHSLAGATVGFGVRNLASLGAGLAELARVLRPGAKLVILEFTTPRWQPFRGLYLFYFRRILPWIGRRISGHGSAYDYLPASVLEFPAPPALGTMMAGAGFRDVRWSLLAGGIVAVHEGTRGTEPN
jgi:demethylmenaquinone methyltransferase / 2-methoxy-6-polyprenyl-1,4-benzoquinol methylase